MSQPTLRLLEAVEEVVKAITEPGSHHRFHYKMRDAHRRQWPYLWERLDELLDADREMRE